MEAVLPRRNVMAGLSKDFWDGAERIALECLAETFYRFLHPPLLHKVQTGGIQARGNLPLVLGARTSALYEQAQQYDDDGLSVRSPHIVQHRPALGEETEVQFPPA